MNVSKGKLKKIACISRLSVVLLGVSFNPSAVGSLPNVFDN